MKPLLLRASLFLVPLISGSLAAGGAEIPIYFAGGQSNATETWKNAAEAQIQSVEPGALIVWAQHGGTPLREWFTTYGYNGVSGRQQFYLTDFYDPSPSASGALETAFAEAVLAGDTPVFKGLLWFQGETDKTVTASVTNDGYFTDFLAFRDQLEADFSLGGDLPTVLAIVYEENLTDFRLTGLLNIREQQTALGDEPLIDTYDTLGLDRVDGVHLTPASATQTGTQMAQALLALPEPSATLLALVSVLALAIARPSKA